jgi:arylsulfatase A-like enzyme
MPVRAPSLRAPAALALAVGALLGCGPRPTDATPGRGLLIVAIDALRADHVSSLGYDRPTTPTLDGLAQGGATFLDAWSAAPEVLPANAALLTGCDPRLARRSEPSAGGPAAELTSWYVPASLPSLAQELLARGFETAAFADHPAISPLRGLGKGFQTFQGFREDAVNPELELGFEGVATRFDHWLAGRAASADWFAYLHLNDLERMWSRPTADPRWDTLYEPRAALAWVPPVAEGDHAFFAIPRPRWAGGSKSLGEYESRYDGALRQLDVKLGRLLEKLRRSGRLDRTTVVVVGTRGVCFGEGGLFLDTGGLTPADLRVPWVIRPAQDLALQRGLRVEGLASLIDVAPTLLDLLGIGAPSAMQGVSHAARLRGLPAPEREVVFAAGGFQRGRAAVDPDWLWTLKRPGDAPSEVLRRTWFGATSRDPLAVTELAPRAPSGGAAAAAEKRLGAAAESWYAWIDRARPLLHGRAALTSDPEMAAELRRRGMLPSAAR